MSETVPGNFELIDNITVVKVGTSVLQQEVKIGTVTNTSAYTNVGAELIKLDAAGNHPVLVSSGAVKHGMTLTGLAERPDITTQMSKLRWLSSVGWPPLLAAWKKNTQNSIIFPFQITRDNLGADDPPEQKMRMKFYETLHTSLSEKSLPVGNEADALSDEEITFGDNDILSAMLAKGIARSALFGSNVRLVILTDVDGFYEDEKDSSTLIPVVENVDAYSHLAGEPGPDGRGGMKSKLQAAKIVNSAGLDMWVANGTLENVVEKVFAGETGTYFPANSHE